MNPSRQWPDGVWELPSHHIALPIEQVGDYPILEQCLKIWRASFTTELPMTIDPVDMPLAAIRGISLLDWDADAGDWVVRLSATLLDEGHGRNMTGTKLAEGFSIGDIAGVRAGIQAIMDRGEPDLMRREFVDGNGRTWSYVRLILPLSSDGVRRDRYALVIDPQTFGQRIDE